MTKLVDDLLRQSLQGTEGWTTATTLREADSTPSPRLELPKAA